MKRFETKSVNTDVLVEFKCDRCKLDFMKDHYEQQEMWIFGNIGGYNSVFGDGLKIELQLCQHCVKEVLGEWLQVGEYDGY